MLKKIQSITLLQFLAFFGSLLPLLTYFSKSILICSILAVYDHLMNRGVVISCLVTKHHRHQCEQWRMAEY